MTLAVSIAQGGSNNVTMRNRIINGAMMIDQRNAGASVTVATDFTYCVDRFNGSRGGSTNNFTMQQSTTTPTGFKNSLLCTMGTGVSVGTTNYALMAQAIEGYNVADLAFGSASSAAFTLSFWVRSSVTGTFGVAFRSGAANATYCATYTITSANTFEYKTITVPAGAINGGTWYTDNRVGVYVIWDLGVGSTYSAAANQLTTGANYFGVTGTTKLSETTGATFYITGVQFEAGTTATPFEQRLYGTELALCQRYCPVFDGALNTIIGNGFMYATTGAIVNVKLPVTTRTPATGMTITAASDFALYWSGSDLTCTSVPFGSATNEYAVFSPTVASGATTNAGCMIRLRSASAKIIFTGCEL